MAATRATLAPRSSLPPARSRNRTPGSSSSSGAKAGGLPVVSGGGGGGGSGRAAAPSSPAASAHAPRPPPWPPCACTHPPVHPPHTHPTPNAHLLHDGALLLLANAVEHLRLHNFLDRGGEQRPQRGLILGEHLGRECGGERVRVRGARRHRLPLPPRPCSCCRCCGSSRHSPTTPPACTAGNRRRQQGSSLGTHLAEQHRAECTRLQVWRRAEGADQLLRACIGGQLELAQHRLGLGSREGWAGKARWAGECQRRAGDGRPPPSAPPPPPALRAQHRLHLLTCERTSLSWLISPCSSCSKAGASPATSAWAVTAIEGPARVIGGGEVARGGCAHAMGAPVAAAADAAGVVGAARALPVSRPPAKRGRLHRLERARGARDAPC